MMATCVIFKLFSWGSLITVFMTDFNNGQRHLVTDSFSKQKETVLLKEILQLVQNQVRKMQTLERELTSINDKLFKCLSISKPFPSGRYDEELQGTTTSLVSREQSTIPETNPTIQLTSAFDLPVVKTEGETETTQDSLSTTDTATYAGGDLEFLSTSTSLAAVIPSTTQAARSMGSRGREFLILFMKNHHTVHGNLSVYITTTNETRVKILTSPHFNAEITSFIHLTSDFKLSLPLNLVGEYSTVEPKGLILQTSELSTVTIFDSFHANSNDGTLVIPTEKLSNRYIVSSTDPYTTSSDYFSQFAIGALYNRTNVEITFKFKENTPLTIQGKSYRDGDVFTVMLGRFETLQIAHIKDLSGSFITSTKPIAVFSGNRCQTLKRGCSHMVTQLPPTTEIDTQYIVPPFYNNARTLIQVLSENSSSVHSRVGNSESNIYLNEKGFKNIEVTSNVTAIIESDQHVLVTAFGMGRPYHPYMTIVPGIHQYLDYYKIIVPEGYEENFICVIVLYQSLINLRINGFSGSHYTSVYQSEVNLTKQFSIRTFKVQSGTFVLSTTDASQFGLIVYGHRSNDGYGFSGNFVN